MYWKNGKRIIQALLVSLGAALFAVQAAFPSGVREGEEESDRTVTLRWFVADPEYSRTWDPKEHVSDAKILEKTGVRLEIQSGGLAELDALIATDSLPDLITMDAGAKERRVLEDSGSVAELEPLFEEYAPDAGIPESMKDWYRNDNGGWYAIASYYYGPERVNEEYGGYLVTHNNNYVRTDLLEQTGVSMAELKMKDGLLRALRAVKGTEYNGREVIPYAGWWTKSIAEQFGMRVEDENGAFLSPYRQPEWREALLFGNQMYREGLISADDFTESAHQRHQQVEAGQIFFCSGYANVQNAREVLRSRDPDAAMEYAGQLRGDAGKRPYLSSVPSGGWTVTLVSADTPYMEEVIRFIAYMTSEEGIIDAAPEMGTDTYEITDQGYIRKSAVEQEFTEDYEKAAEKYYMNLEFFVDWTVVQKYQKKSEYEIFRSQYRDCTIYDSKARDAAGAVDGSIPMAETKEKIEDYYRRAEVRILTSPSEEECIRRYEETIAAMEEMGLLELEAYEQLQYRTAKEKLS